MARGLNNRSRARNSRKPVGTGLVLTTTCAPGLATRATHLHRQSGRMKHATWKTKTTYHRGVRPQTSTATASRGRASQPGPHHTLRKGNCCVISLNGEEVPQKDGYKYLGVHLDRRLTWKKHIDTKISETRLKSRQLYWLLGKHSKLKLEYKLLLYKSMLKPIW